ncbi:MAG TPA: hypothetical protein VFX76_08585, partial [Roseiflexaceae bacterium]|nr:hypothetical protein [Roseiflexaceae bacterium]
MTTTTPNALERAVARYGDSLYRLALLLTPNEAQAATAVRGATTRLVGIPPAQLDETTLLAALVAALPPERRGLPIRTLPPWAKTLTGRPNTAMLATLARLPRQERLALGLLLLHGLELDAATHVFGGDEQRL